MIFTLISQPISFPLLHGWNWFESCSLCRIQYTSHPFTLPPSTSIMALLVSCFSPCHFRLYVSFALKDIRLYTLHQCSKECVPGVFYISSSQLCMFWGNTPSSFSPFPHQFFQLPLWWHPPHPRGHLSPVTTEHVLFCEVSLCKYLQLFPHLR